MPTKLKFSLFSWNLESLWQCSSIVTITKHCDSVFLNLWGAYHSWDLRVIWMEFWSQKWELPVKVNLILSCKVNVKLSPWRRMGSEIIDLGTKRMWVVRFTPRPLYHQRKSPRYPLYTRLGGPQNRSGRCGIERYQMPIPGIEPRPSRSQPVAIPTEILRLIIKLYIIVKVHIIGESVVLFYCWGIMLYWQTDWRDTRHKSWELLLEITYTLHKVKIIIIRFMKSATRHDSELFQSN
jgi:hypothetical protein